jgi:sulfonate transport system substrate-binding protein
MQRLQSLACVLASALLLAASAPAGAEVADVHIGVGFGIGYLPLLIMKHDQLVEKHLRTSGLGSTTVSWKQIGSGATMNDALLAGDLHFASGGSPPFLLLWDKTHGSLGVKAVGALVSMPNFLNTIDPRIKSIRDYTPTDRIAIAGAGSSTQSIYLQMAVAQIYGYENFNKLNTNLVSLSHPDGMAAMLSGQDVKSQFTSAPFQYQELQRPEVHRVASSYDIVGGRNTFLIVWSTKKFRDGNPKTYAAVYAALQEATKQLNADKRAAAAIYLAESKSNETMPDVLKMLEDPDIKFTLAPERIMKFVEFMNRVGTLKNKPASWKELFFPEVHGLTGS